MCVGDWAERFPSCLRGVINSGMAWRGVALRDSIVPELPVLYSYNPQWCPKGSLQIISGVCGCERSVLYSPVRVSTLSFIYPVLLKLTVSSAVFIPCIYSIVLQPIHTSLFCLYYLVYSTAYSLSLTSFFNFAYFPTKYICTHILHTHLCILHTHL